MTFPRKLMRGRPRHTPGQMNKLEEKYAVHLEQLKIVGDILGYRFESVKLKLAPATFYTPDFWVQMADGGVEMHETKGGPFEDDARAKIKIAAEMFHEFIFRVARWNKKDGWHYETITRGGQ